MSKRDRTRSAIHGFAEDVAARNAAIGVLRMRKDPGYRRRYGDYLRGELEMSQVLQGETHAQWYARELEAGRE